MPDEQAQAPNLIQIRKMAPADVPSCAGIIERNELFQQYGFTGSAASRLLHSTLADPLSDLVVAERNGTIIGFGWVVAKAAFHRSAYLRLIAVDPEQGRGGVGSALLKDLETRHLSPSGLFLLVTSTNTAARAFYEQLGYARVGMIPDYVKKGIDECVYFKPSPA